MRPASPDASQECRHRGDVGGLPVTRAEVRAQIVEPGQARYDPFGQEGAGCTGTWRPPGAGSRGGARRAIPYHRLEMAARPDRILTEHATEIAGLTVYTVLATPRRVPSRILERDSYAYWDKVAGADFDSASEFLRLLKEDGLLRQQGEALGIEQLDRVSDRRVWHSGVKYAELFRCKLTHRLRAGDLLLQINVTWSHATRNWTPGSGGRQVAAAFA